MSCALAVAACRPTATPPPSNRVPVVVPARTCPRDLTWFPRARYLRYSLFTHGHFGEWRFHADFYRLEGEERFAGVATGSYRQHPDAPVHTESRAVEVATKDATALLTALRDGVAIRSEDPEGSIVVSDSSRSVVIAIEAMAFDPRVGRHPNSHVEFFTDDGETEPQQWNIRGCTYDPPLATRRVLQRLTEAFANSLGNDAMLQKLSGQP
jgi:hypothetical protein